MNVGIVGLGLIGGSMAKSIKTRTAHTVFGADLDAETMTLARLSGAIDGALTDETLPRCDMVLVAIRPAAAVDWVNHNADQIAKSAILVDLCGVKRGVCAAIAPVAKKYGFSYIGGHPMAGRERGGFVNSGTDLFSGASMILTPDANTDMRMLETLKSFFTDTGFAGLTVFHAGRTRPHRGLHIPACAYRLQRVCQVAGGAAPARVFRRELQGYDARGAPRRGDVDGAFFGRRGLPDRTA